MGFRNNHSWVTGAVNDGSVSTALVLAESIRQTMSTRKIAVITSIGVSAENRHLLREKFDIVFLLEEIRTSNEIGRDAQAKAYSLSLTAFEKCVFVSHNSLFLENADSLFDSNHNFQACINEQDRTLNLTLFMFKPDKHVWSQICKSVVLGGQDLTEEYLGIWLQNQELVQNGGRIKTEMFLNLSLSTRKLTGNQTHSAIIHFEVDKKKEIKPLAEQILNLANTMDVGLREKLILDLWLKIYRKTCSSIPKTINNQIWKPSALQADNEPIAIVGMSCRYPGANNLEEFWNLLFAGEEGICEPPSFRWTKEHSLRVTPQDRKTAAGFLSMPVDEFDATFFGLSPKDVVFMDPQYRIMHEVLWESLEDAGINPQSLYGSQTAIFTGSWSTDYKEMLINLADEDLYRASWGNNIGAAASRLSHLLGLTGPCIATESACSSGMVALHMAVKSLRARETNLALAGGVNLLLHPYNITKLEVVLAPSGRCKTFDAKADGFGRGEGCGVLVLKRLSDALVDRDNIWAVIRGSAVSQEGISRRLGRPTVNCEALAMQLALEDANVTPEQVSFVEAYGTGTQVGDPMEVAAIAKAYYSPSRKEPLVIGSVKTNVGHTESCSGITGIMKAALSLQHELIPKHLNLETVNPEIFLDSIPAIIPTENLPWPKIPGQSRMCGVSSFGITGTDGHVIIEEAPDYDLPKFNLGLQRPTHLMTISGKSSQSLEELLAAYKIRLSELANNKDNSFANAAFSANVGRASFPHRTFLVANNFQDAVKMLKEKKCSRAEVKEENNLQICMLFTGQGSQYQGMAKLLYETSPVFKVAFDRCETELREKYNISICQVLWKSEPNSKELSRTIYSQTSIFCVEYCLLKLWESWGIKPNYVLGHSLGEFCAAVAAGVLDFEDALKLVAERSRLIDNLPRGSMLVVKASKPEVEKWMKDAEIDLDFASVNNPEQTVVAGDTKTIESFLAYLKGQSIKAIILEATHAFHSRHMNPMLEDYRKVALSINYKTGSLPIQYLSGMEGRIIDDHSEIGADYWVRHTREKVSFIDACTALRESGCQNFLEVGPQPVLSSFVMMNNEGTPLNCFPSLRKGTNDWETILTSLGKLYLLGYPVNWKGYDEPYSRKKVSLPFHPFHRKSFWVDCSSNNVPIIHPLLGSLFANASALTIFQNDLTTKSAPYLKDHCLGSRILFPGAGFAEMCLSAGYCVANGLTEILDQPTRAMRLENLCVEAPLELKEGKACRFQAIVDLLPETATFQVKIFHQNIHSTEDSEKWVLHARANFIPVANTKDCMSHWNPSRIPEIISCTEPNSTESFYKRVDETGLKFGESFRMLKRIWAVKQENCEPEDCTEILAEMELPSDWNKYLLHPLIIDAVFQTGILAAHSILGDRLKVPVSLGGLTLLTGLGCEMDGKIYMHAINKNRKTMVFISTHTWRPVAFVEDLELVDTTVKTIESVLEQQSNAVPDCWEETWKPIGNPFNSQVTRVEKPSKEFSSPEFIKRAQTIGNATHEERKLHEKNKRLMFLYILNACQELGWKPEVGLDLEVDSFCTLLEIKPEFRKLVRFYFSVFEEDAALLQFIRQENKWRLVALPPENQAVIQEMTKLAEELKASPVFEKITVIHEHFAKNLSRILLGQQSALNILFPTEETEHRYSAYTYYQVYPCRRQMSNMANLIQSNAFSRTNYQNEDQAILKVLEVGSGTGTMSEHLLEQLRASWGDQFEFWYTDISQTFLVRAQQRFEDYRENMKFEVFNIEQSPLSQGIPLGYFDLVCASDVVHATRDLEESLVHLRQTLRSGGIIYFSETVVPARDITFVFGLLDGFWRFEDLDWRPYHCCVGVEVWDKVLSKCGFRHFHWFKTGVDQFAYLTAVADPEVKVECLMARRMLRKDVQKDWTTWVIFADRGYQKLGSMLANMLVVSGSNVMLCLKRGEILPEGITGLKEEVALEEIEFGEEDASGVENILRNSGAIQGVIYSWGMNTNEKDQKNVALPFLHIVNTLVDQSMPPKLYVVTRGVHPVRGETGTCQPTSATLSGMVKSLKNQCFDMFVRMVDLEVSTSTEELAAQLLYELALVKGPRERHRAQVAYRGNVRYEPRLEKSLVRNKSEDLRLPPSTQRYQLRLPESRMIQDLEFESIGVEPVGDSKIEVKVKAFALNFRDILIVLKPTKEFEKHYAVGLEFSGVVTRAGPEAKWKVGQRVIGCNDKEAQLPSHLVVDSEFVTGIPERMTEWEAATLPGVFSTAYHCLINLAKMKKGDKVLIHTGSGGVGLAAIQLAKMVGAEIVTTAGNPRKRAYLRGLGIQHVFHSRNSSFEQDILKVTNGEGVDVVLNSITGPGIKEATLRATAKNGRFVEMSKLSIWTPEEVKALRPDVDYRIVDLIKLDVDTQIGVLEHVEAFLRNGQIKPIPFVKFDALRIRQALQYFQKAKHIGKVVVTMPEVSTVEGRYKTEIALFNPQSTYLVTGGLGGIGFAVCQWMLGLGATDVVLLGRNPPAPEIAEQIQGLQEKGYNACVKLGDVGNAEQCQALIDEIRKEMKPLRGVMHCAGVLRDNLYPNQNWENFQAVFNPKVQGTWNLHEMTKELPLEHFVVYSSAAALFGTPGQCNHAAANCFEDAFIHYRHSLGLPGLSINWGQWSQVGVAKEINCLCIQPVSAKRMLKGLEMALRTETKQLSLCDFASLNNISAVIPMANYYLDERVLKQYANNQAHSSLDLNSVKFWQDMDSAQYKADKVSVFSSYFKQILRDALRMEADEKLSETADLQELGVDSLMMIELKNAMQGLLGSKVSVTTNMLKNCNTIQLISETIVGVILKEQGDQGVDTALDPLEPVELLQLLKKDSQLPEELHIAPETEPAVKASEMRSVLVTGATGQLGPYVLQEICKEYKSVEKIYCLLRGTQGDAKSIEKLKAHLKALGLHSSVTWNKIEGVAGNVAMDNLGIDFKKYAKLSKSVDGIVHLAAKTDANEHLRSAQENGKGTDCRSVNILGTLNILKFACSVKVKRVFYASTILSGIFGESKEDVLPDNWPKAGVIQTIVDNKFPGIQSSKWICEMLMEQANQRGIPCKVFRFPWIAGDSKTGKVSLLNNTYILRFLGFLKISAMPDSVIPVVILPADICAQVALKLFVNDNTRNEIFNVAHPKPELEQEFVHVAKNEFGIDLQILEWNSFAEQVNRYDGKSDEMQDLFRDLKKLNEYFIDAAGFLTKYAVSPDTYFANAKVSKFIPDYGADFPSTMQMVENNLKYLKGNGLLEKFGI